MNVSIWWIPVALFGGLLSGGLLGGYFATKGCRKKIEELEEERIEETREMSEMREKYGKKLDEEEKNVDEKLEKDMNEVSKPVKSVENTSRRVVDHPVRINESEYNRDVDTGVDYEELMYYRIDSVLTDAHDEVIDNPEGLVGKDVWESLDSVESDMIFVRNFELETDYEISIDSNLSYYRDIASQ